MKVCNAVKERDCPSPLFGQPHCCSRPKGHTGQHQCYFPCKTTWKNENTKKILKPNGKPLNTFVISIDDGYVEYSYDVVPKTRKLSIVKIYQKIRKALGAEETESIIRYR